MLSKFGVVTRKIRGERKESLRTMAKNLSISPAFLSILELGRKKIPPEYSSKINEIYQLSDDLYKELVNSIIETNEHVDINIKTMNEAQKEVSMIFARRILNADNDLIEKLKAVLEEDNNENKN